MAKKIKATDVDESRTSVGDASHQVMPLASYSGSFTGDFTGDFTGPLYGNADSATSLRDPFTVVVVGDATGSFATAGSNTNLHLTVTKARNAEWAAVADTAKDVQSAALATHATSANNATYAAEAGLATRAKLADHATDADNAVTAGRATHADYAANTDHATTSDRADVAARAETADVARALANPDDPVEYAKHADFADKALLAQHAQYDCLGRSFTCYYALKSELKPYDDLLTIQDADHLFVKREDQILQATVRGKAYGSGYVDGNTLRIFIESVAKGEDCGSVYDDIIFGEFPDECHADTTKIYIDCDGVMHIWDHDNRRWTTIRGLLPPEILVDLNARLGYMDRLLKQWEQTKKDVVTVHGDQTIEGKKYFAHLVRSPIADIDTDNARVLVCVHNLKDVRDTLRAEATEAHYKLYQMIDSLTDRMDASERGDFQVGEKDYTVPAHQSEMVVGTIYMNFLDKNKQYIPVDPDGAPLDPTKEIWYVRYIQRLSNGVVRWRDVKNYIDPELWVPWTIERGDTDADGDGQYDVKHRNIVLAQTDKLMSTCSTGERRSLIFLSEQDTVHVGTQKTGLNLRALDGKVTINGKDIIATDAMLDEYLPLTGGTLTGDLEVPDVPLATDSQVVMNSHIVRELIDSKLREYDNNLNLAKYMPKAGGAFTGKITVPDSIDLEAARNSDDVLNAGDIETLIKLVGLQLGWVRLVRLEAPPVSCAELEENVLYSVPVYEFDTNSEINSIRVEPTQDNIDPYEGEGIVYGARDLLG